MKKIYDVAKILTLYKKYGNLNAVYLRTGTSPTAIKKILIENNVEIKKYVATRWSIK